MNKLILQKNIQLIVIVIFTLLAYLNILGNQFVIDDKTFIADWQTKNSFANVGKLLAGDVPAGHEGVYRPIRSLLYEFDWKIFGANPIGYHLQAILIHLACTVLVYLIVESSGRHFKKRSTNLESRARGVYPDPATSEEGSSFLKTLASLPFVAALLFGLHPVHTETITYISSSMESIGLVFFFGSFYSYIKFRQKSKKDWNWLACSVILSFLAFFSTEVTLSLPFVIILWEICFKKRSLFFAPHILIALFYIALRFLVFNVGARGPYLADSVYLTFLTMTKVFIKYLSLLILPINQANNHVISKGIEAFVYRDYRTAAISAQSILDPVILASLLVIVLLIGVAVVFLRKLPVITFAIFWFFVTLLPASEIIPQGSVMNEKLLYLPSLGFCLLVAYIVARFFSKAPQVVSVLLVLLVLFYAGRTYVRNADWHDSIKLWSRDVERYPEDNAYAYFQLGNAYSDLGVTKSAVENYQKSFEINPRFVVAVGSIAKAYAAAGKGDMAIDVYLRALSINPEFWEAHLQLAGIYRQQGDFDKARLEYNEVLKLVPNLAGLKQNLGTLPQLAEATQSPEVSDDLWLSYHQKGLSFKAPSKWKIKSIIGGLELVDEKGEFKVSILTGADVSQNQKYGELVNQGKALIPNFDEAWVKVWRSKEAEGTILQFSLTKGTDKIEVLVGPPESEQMRNFDIILGSIRFAK